MREPWARIAEAAPQGHWKVLTILGAISTRGLIATMTVEAATGREIFVTYIGAGLVSATRRRGGDGQPKFAQGGGVHERIKAAGATLLYLPPYSPDLNPIEKAWAKLKQLFDAAKARTKEALDLAITQLLPLLTDQDAEAWFRLPFTALQE